ncbi:MAG: Gfo/Idh/MocA family protein [Planctomycetota bacterium]|jgi:predicted dehydrogenase
MIRVGIIGVGYWGPNLVRSFDSLRDCQVAAVCDRDVNRLKQICETFPAARLTTDATELLNHDLDAVVIATPTNTHYSLAKEALERGLHTFAEKPLATNSGQCQELIRLADRRGAVLFVGHVFLYSAPVAKLKELVSNGELGELCYISSSRLNLGPVRQDVNALWDLAPHDVSIILDLMGAMPQSVSCSGLAYLNDSVHDVCSLTLHFEDKKMGIVHVSWLDPRKRRVMTIVGSKRMAVYDDIEPLEKIKIYDRGIDAPTYTDSFGEFQYSYRYGDTYSPRLVEKEPLKIECRSFIDCIVKGVRPKTDGQNGLQVVRVIHAADRSLRDSGARIPVEQSVCPQAGNGEMREVVRIVE